MTKLQLYPMLDPRLTRGEFINHLLLWNRLSINTMFEQNPLIFTTDDEFKLLQEHNQIEIRSIKQKDFLDMLEGDQIFRKVADQLITKEAVLDGVKLMSLLEMDPYYGNLTEIRAGNFVTSSMLLSW